MNEQLARRFVETSLNGGFDDVEDVVAPDFVGYCSGPPGDIHGPEELEEFPSEIREAFADIELTIGVVRARTAPSG